MTEGTDYTVSYENNINAGTGNASVTFKGNYAGNTSKSFTIEKADSPLAFESNTIVIDALGGSVDLADCISTSAAGNVTYAADGSLEGITVDGSKFTTDFKQSVYGKITVTVTDSGDANHKSGTVTLTVKSELKNGYYIDNGSGLVDGTTVYAELADAVAACPQNAESVICAVGSPEITKPVVIDNGKTIRLSTSSAADSAAELMVSDSYDRAGYIFTVAGGAKLALDDIGIDAKSASDGVGLIDVYGALTTSGSVKFAGGSAENGGAVYARGGSTVTLGGTFTGNAATDKGGAIYVDSANRGFTVNGGSITNNDAVCGDGIFLDSVAMKLDGTDATKGITDNIGIADTTSKIEVTSADVTHNVYVEFDNPQEQSGETFVTSDSLAGNQLKGHFRVSNSGYTFNGEMVDKALVLTENADENVIFFDSDDTDKINPHIYSNVK